MKRGRRNSRLREGSIERALPAPPLVQRGDRPFDAVEGRRDGNLVCFPDAELESVCFFAHRAVGIVREVPKLDHSLARAARLIPGRARVGQDRFLEARPCLRSRAAQVRGQILKLRRHLMFLEHQRFLEDKGVLSKAPVILDGFSHRIFMLGEKIPEEHLHGGRGD